LVASRSFNIFILSVIALNGTLVNPTKIPAAFLAMYDPVADKYNLASVRNYILYASDLFFILVYTLEMLLKMFAWGVFLEGPGMPWPNNLKQGTYFKSWWNWVDFLVVILGWVAFGLDRTTAEGAPAGIRAIRVLRPLRTHSS
jgi:hypothetical protein